MRAPARLESSDFVYRFVDTAFGWSVVLQVAWTFSRPPNREALSEMAARLADGPLNRRLVTPRVPLARPYWTQSTVHPGVIVDEGATESPNEWLNAELDTVPLTAEAGRCWQLRGVATETGGFVLSLCALHLVADGKTLVSAASSARDSAPLQQPQRFGRASMLGSDLEDAARQFVSAGLGICRAAVAVARGSGAAGNVDVVKKAPLHERAPLARPVWATVTVDRQDWEVVAKRHGGTANSLFVAVVSGLLRTSGYAPLGQTVKVGIPVSQRVDGDTRGNATAGVSVYLTEEPVAGGDLAGIRSACKRAFAALSAGRRPAFVHLQPLLQMLPARLIATAASAGSGMPDAVVSNLGSFPAELAEIGDEIATSVFFRGIAQHVDPSLPFRFGDGVQSWLLEVGDDVSFSVVAFDETHFGDDAVLRDLLAGELAGWGVPHRIS